MRPRASSRISLAVLVGLNWGSASGCSYALHPRTTLAGRAIDWVRLEALASGTTEAAVAEAIGPADEVRTEDGDTVWSYYERAQLRGCTEKTLFITTGMPPVVEYTGHVRFRNGVVAGVPADQRPSNDRSTSMSAPP